MAYNDTLLKGLFSRVYDNQMNETDSQDIKDYVKKVFGDGGVTPDPSLLHQFNNLVVQKADEIAKPKVTNLLTLLATVKSSARDQLVKIDIPVKSKAKVKWSATGSGVDLTRVEGKKSEVAVPQTFSTGFYYEPLDLVKDSEENFRKLINDIADAKVRLFLVEINKLITAAISSGKIPAKNVKVGSNIALADYNKIASTLARYGGQPLFIADSLLIDYFAMQQATDTTIKGLLYDEIKKELLTALNPTTIGRTTAMNLVNPFLDETNSTTELPVNIGYMFAGGVNNKPFHVVEYGGLRQLTEQDIEDERVKMKIVQDAAIDLLFGEALGYIKEDAAVTL